MRSVLQINEENVTVQINGHEVKLQLGTVSDFTLTSQETWRFGQTSIDLFKCGWKECSIGILKFERDQ